MSTTVNNSPDHADAGGLRTDPEAPVMDRPALEPLKNQPPISASPMGASAYEAVALALVPAWRRIIGSAPWWRVARTLRSLSAPHPCLIQYRLSAALGLVVADQLDPAESESHTLIKTKKGGPQDEVRAELVQWRSAIDPDGRPKQLRARGSPLWPVVAQQIVRLLDHAPGCQTSATLADLERHLRWLSQSRPRSPWSEAALIESLGCGAVLIRDSKVLHTARERLRPLLHRQSAEGWFPERGGADAGRLSLMLDALTPLWCDHGWDELRAPLEKAVLFLGVLIEAGAADVPCINARGTGFVVPFGIERLAVRMPRAVQVATLLRERFGALAQRAGLAWDDERSAMLGSSIALTAGLIKQHHTQFDAEAKPADMPVEPHQSVSRDSLDFSEAGLHIKERSAYRAVIASRRGGMIFLRWASGRTLEDAGVTVVFPHTIRTSSRSGTSDPTRCESDTLSWRGLLTRVRRKRPGIILQLWRWLLRLIRRRGRTVTARFHTDGARGRQRLLHDWFSREVTLGDSEVRIRDQVLCRLPCEAVVVGDASGPGVMGRRWGSLPDSPSQSPVMVEGGRAVAITRTYRDGVLVDVTVERQVDIV